MKSRMLHKLQGLQAMMPLLFWRQTGRKGQTFFAGFGVTMAVGTSPIGITGL
jgi:hypothetical protein